MMHEPGFSEPGVGKSKGLSSQMRERGVRRRTVGVLLIMAFVIGAGVPVAYARIFAQPLGFGTIAASPTARPVTPAASPVVAPARPPTGMAVSTAQAGMATGQETNRHGRNMPDMAYPCGLTNPAFCDNFAEGPAPVKGRGNDLDYRRWSFNRGGAGATNGMGTIWAYYPTTAQHCKTTITNVTPPNDSFFCGSEVPEPEHWMEAFNDGGSFVFNDGRIRQPFDFTNRTGTIQYGVDAKNSGSHGWWTETWITDQPVPGPNFQENFSCCDEESQPANAIGLAFDATCGAAIPAGSSGATLTGVGTIYVARDHSISTLPNELGENTHCVSAQPDSANLIQIKLSTTRVEVWMSDHGSNVLQEVAAATISPALPFSVGYVHFEHMQYNAAKVIAGIQAGITPYQTYHWHDMGFDGPVWPTPRAYEVPDSLTPADQPSQNGDTGGVNLGYVVDSSGRLWNGATYLPGFTLNNVDLGNAASARLNLSTGAATAGTTFYYQFNGGAWRSYTVPAGVTSADRETASIPVALSDLRAGTNTLLLKASAQTTGPNMALGTMTVANIELEVVPNGTPTAAPAAPMIPCALFQLMMQTMPQMTMVSDPCGAAPMPSTTHRAQHGRHPTPRR